MSVLFTKADYARLPEGFPAQLIEGKLVRESAPLYGHQHAVARICASLFAVVGADRVLPSPVDVPIDAHNVFQPDVAIYREPPPHDVGGALVPLAVFEVLSPSTARQDRGAKLRHYLEAGVEEVWLVDPAAEAIEVHTPRGVRIAYGTEPARSACVPGLALVPTRVLKPV